MRVSRIWAIALVATLVTFLTPTSAIAQSTAASIQGTIVDESGPLPGAAIVAKDKASGFAYETAADSTGAFTLTGLRPGTYAITVTMGQYKPQARDVQVLVGQSVTANFKITPDVLYTEQVQVVGASRLLETRTSEITTTVTEEQIRHLPQNQRNFLNFAALAPGARVSDDETRKQVTGAGLDATQINVFIDGVSYKNDVLDGGVVGQDSSRGSPFPQTAVQEFQVLTQNYKAEHEKASSLVISAVTKSGSNRWSGEGFLFYQDKHLVSSEFFAKQRGDPKPTFKRFQPGGAIGGPIIKDRMQGFGSYEENRQDHANRVFLGTSPFPPSLNFLRESEGTFISPFREKLAFAKLTTQPRSGQALEFSYSLRTETDIRSFGQQTSFDSAENVRNRVDSGLARWMSTGPQSLNEATLTIQRSNWNPLPQNTADVGLNYLNVMRIGGRDTTQDFVQTRISLRDDYTRYLHWRGTHAVKSGAVLSFLRYDVTKTLFGNPLFEFRIDENYAFPFQARYGVGNPDLSANNRQLGFFVQDDWTASSRLTINAGLRWDYESDMLNNDYVTPDVVRQNVAPFVDGSRYFTDGNDRPPFYGAWQPRVGLSYDLMGSGKHVLFGGYGRYYDRVIYNAGLDERYRLQYAVRSFQFSLDGAPRNGQSTIIWNPAYQSKAGLDGLIALGIAPTPEVFLLDNNTRPPVSDQFNAGVRSNLHGIQLTANYAGLRGQNGLTFIFGNRRPDGSCCQTIPGVFTNVLISSDAKKNWFDALYLTAERPFNQRWGFRVNYTLGQAEAIGGDLFSLDYRRVEDYPRHPAATDERHRLVITGIVGLPADFILSTFTTLASGLGFTIVDNSLGSNIDQRRVLLFAGRPPEVFNYKSVDLRLEKMFRFANQQASIAVEGFNVFNATNFGCYNGDIPPKPAVNVNFGVPSCTVDNSSRRLQFGVRYSF
jgi:Carboxypeptidase regulatory-like domain/TonB dependent receptor-like, beta-barrel